MFDLVFSGIGGLLVGNSVYWRLRAIRVDGQVMGVRQGTKTGNAVYRYTLPSGQSHEATSTEGSSSVRGKETGTVVPLLVMAQQPDKVVEARSHIVDVVGVVLFAAGAWILYIAVTSWPFGPMSWIVAAVLVGRFAIAIYRSILPREKRLRPASGSYATRVGCGISPSNLEFRRKASMN